MAIEIKEEMAMDMEVVFTITYRAIRLLKYISQRISNNKYNNKKFLLTDISGSQDHKIF